MGQTITAKIKTSTENLTEWYAKKVAEHGRENVDVKLALSPYGFIDASSEEVATAFMRIVALDDAHLLDENANNSLDELLKM